MPGTFDNVDLEGRAFPVIFDAGVLCLFMLCFREATLYPVDLDLDDEIVAARPIAVGGDHTPIK